MIARHPRCRFQGSYVALPTPFRSGRVDLGAFQDLVEWHSQRRTDGIVVAGTTGEAATLTDGERRALFDAAVACARGRFPVISSHCAASSIVTKQRLETLPSHASNPYGSA